MPPVSTPSYVKRTVLTAINRTTAFDSVRTDFEQWLRDSGASEITIRNYCSATRRWLEILSSNADLRPAIIYQRCSLSKPMKRIIGYACRRYIAFMSEVMGEIVELGIPSRLPAASRPNPSPISTDEFWKLSRAAKKLFPKETALTVRVWLQFLRETGCRRAESNIDWSSIDWFRSSVTICGKTGERELPLSRQMVRRFQFLFARKRRPYPWIGNRGQRLSMGVLYCLFKRISAAIGHSELRPHLLRHSRLTELCASELGANQLLVLSFAGSASLSSLQYYYQVSLDQKKRLLEGK
jgi:integrase